MSRAPTRFGRLSFTVLPVTTTHINGTVAFAPLPGATPDDPPLISVHLRRSTPLIPHAISQHPPAIEIVPTDAASMVAWHDENETAVFQLQEGKLGFNFSVSLALSE